jgi:hypothetical protein
MGLETDQEIVQLIGTEPEVVTAISASFEECVAHSVYTTTQARECIFPFI